ncbi:ABC transporter substrate-binding protein [Alicyclobacillus acidoterrestris]|nr:ABC transporter substrate-binding protein [Alicyclobacillus acidoterrestris]
MRKLTVFLPMLLLLLAFVSGCSASTSSNTSGSATSRATDMVTYQSENGPIQVPAHPKRVVVIDIDPGDVMKLGVHVVGVDSWAEQNPYYKPYLKGVAEVSADDLEKIAALKPDLIICYSTTKNIDRLQKIAPTVAYTYGKLNYLQQIVAIGKLVNQEAKAKAWVASFQKRATALGEKIKAKIGDNATVSVVGTSGKQFYVFGNNWGRGTEILYQAMHLKMPTIVQEKALKPGYYNISQEVLPQYCGDYVILSLEPGSDTSFEKTQAYKDIPAVKNHHVFVVNDVAFSHTDPISLDYQLDFFKKAFLGQ